MVGNNINKKIFPFFDSVKTPVTEAGTSDSLHLNCAYETLNIEVTGITSGSIKVEGCINVLNSDGTAKTDDECTWTKITAINASSLTTTDTISANGIYTFGISSLNRVRVVVESVSGNATIVGVAGV